MKEMFAHIDLETRCFAFWLQHVVHSVAGLIVAMILAVFVGQNLLGLDITTPAWASAATAMLGLCAARFIVAPLLFVYIRAEFFPRR